MKPKDRMFNSTPDSKDINMCLNSTGTTSSVGPTSIDIPVTYSK